MDPSKHALTRRAFTLVELLVALSLVAVIGTLALLLLNSTRKVSAEVNAFRLSASEILLRELEQDLYHLHRKPSGKEWPPFELLEGSRLQFTTHLQLETGTRIPVACSYRPEGRGSLRIVESPYLSTGLTNRIDRLKRPLTFQLLVKEEWVSTWPPEETESAEAPPVLLRVQGDLEDGTGFSHVMAIPAHLRIENKTFEGTE